MKVIAFYSENKNRGTNFLAATNKLNYIFACLNNLGHNIEILSESSVSYTEKMLAEEEKQLNEFLNIKYPTALPCKSVFQRVFRKFFNPFLIKKFLNKNLKIGDTVFIYHSITDHLYLKPIIKKKKLNVILEVEEIYGDVSKNRKLKNRELHFFRFANGYIFPTQLLDKLINFEEKPNVIIHGTYNEEKDYGEKFNDGLIHCVYAGTLDPRKGGAQAAIESASFLDEKYRIHILGFGSKKDRMMLEKRIAELNEKSDAKIIFEGEKSGEEYLRFLQKCDIGLSTQKPEGDYNNSSFPSKILSYISNGLRVVTVRIPVVETSSICDHVYYSKSNSGKDIADAIISVDFSKYYDGREIISKLNKTFIYEFNSFLKKVQNE